MLLRSPLFTVAAVLCLGFGIGANAAIFPFFYEFLIDPLPFQKSKQLMAVYQSIPERGLGLISVSWPDFQEWRENNRIFSGITASDWRRYTLTGRGDPERLEGVSVTHEYFDVFGTQPQLGRGFRPEDEEPGAPGVVLLSNGFWKGRFGGDRNILGESLLLSESAYTVIGIMPRDFAYPDGVMIWTALRDDPTMTRGSHFLDVVGRLKPGISIEDAQVEMEGIALRFAEEFPDTNRGMSVRLRSLREDLTEGFKEPVSIFFGVVCFVLLLACANVANLLLARAAAREREIAVRVTLGAGRMRVMRQMLTESVLLSLIGGTLGIALGSIGKNLIVRYIPEEIPYYLEFSMNGWVILILVGITALCGILFGMAPALETARSDLNQVLTEGSGRTGGSRRLNLFRSFLVVFEIALALIVLTGAGLMMKGFVRLYMVDPGFDPAEKLTMRVTLPGTDYDESWERNEFFTETLDRLELVPGVTSATVISHLPMSRSNWAQLIRVEGTEPDPEGRLPVSNRRAVSPGYFTQMGIPLLRGRDFGEYDSEGTPRVVIINERMAERFWPGEDPLGRRITFAAEPAPGEWVEVVGVVGDVRQSGLNRGIPLCTYSPVAQDAMTTTFFVVSTTGDPLEMVEPVRRAVWSIDPDLPLFQVKAMTQVMRERNWEEPLYTLLFGIFSVIALVLASVGVYGVIAYSVSQRIREFGIRMALGADSGKVLRLVVGRGALLGAIGIGVGVIASLMSMKLLESLLFGVNHDDLMVYAVAAVLMGVMALAASFLPARRATLVDPVEALRVE